MRAVLDTNVLISAYVFPGGPPEAVFRRVLEGQLEIATSRPLLAELERVLEHKFGWAPDRAAAAIVQILRVGTVVQPTESVAVVLADPADDRVLEAASTFGAQVIVTGDRHLLQLKSWRSIEMLSPAEFLARTVI